jgi:hypothetical protein
VLLIHWDLSFRAANQIKAADYFGVDSEFWKNQAKLSLSGFGRGECFDLPGSCARGRLVIELNRQAKRCEFPKHRLQLRCLGFAYSFHLIFLRLDGKVDALVLRFLAGPRLRYSYSWMTGL